MPRPSPYTDKQKAAIREAVKMGRKAGKKWHNYKLEPSSINRSRGATLGKTERYLPPKESLL